MAFVRRAVIATVPLLLLLAACGREQAAAEPGRAVVAQVVDGDTIHARVGGGIEKVRLIGIDTPETRGAGGLRECFGAEATKRTQQLLPPGTAITLVRDVEARDRYGRLLAYVYRADDKLFVNMALARDGFAAALTLPPNVAHADEFVAAAAEARRESRGLWAKCGGADTPIP